MHPSAAQHHKILRQVLEVRGCAADETERVQAVMRDTFYRHLLPMIEKTCSALSTPDRVHRIAVLDIDLGELPSDTLEAAAADRFDRAFADELAAALGSADSVEEDVELELYSYFVRTGTVPWWADRRDRQLLDKSLDALIERDPRALRRAIESAPDQDTVWRRIALTHPDRQLDDLAGVLVGSRLPAPPGFGTEWLALIQPVSRDHGRPPTVARNLWWEELLRAASAGGGPASDVPRFFGEVLRRLAGRLGVAHGALVEGLHRAGDHPELSIPLWVRTIVESIREHMPIAAGIDGSFAAHEELTRLLAESEASARLDGVTSERVKELIERLPSGARAEALARARQAQRGEAPPLDVGRPVGSIRPDVFSEPSSAGPESLIDRRFSDADELYVQNAGLVILWPFLEPFFAGLGLLTETKHFIDAAARQRAVGLLQHLAADDAAAPEFQVPLNKVLCGVPLDDVFDFGAPITDVEIEACTDLLAAVIHHAPVLREMSIGGFRHSFLLREGQLSVRDGHWLLRVTRETHDIVLDRFPWSASVVRFPWTAGLIQVEW